MRKDKQKLNTINSQSFFRGTHYVVGLVAILLFFSTFLFYDSKQGQIKRNVPEGQTQSQQEGTSPVHPLDPLVKVAIVSTMRSPGKELDSWICYHLGLGFHTIYLFFDDPNDPDIPIAQKYSPRVQIIPTNTELKNKWKVLSYYNNFKWWIDVEVMARQCLNVGIAIQMAVKDKIDWILHIDADELFYLPDHYSNVNEHFSLLHKQGFDQAVYVNLEAVPENLEADNYFQNTTLFKISSIVITSQSTYNKYNEFWESKGSYFNGYWTGKAAARVFPQLEPLEVTRFFKPNEKRANFNGPWILHYINPTYTSTKKKYEKLGSFADKSWDRKYVPSSELDNPNYPYEGQALKSHRDMRDLFAKPNEQEKKKLYMKQIGIQSKEELLKFRNHLLQRNTFIRDFLNHHKCKGDVPSPTQSHSPLSSLPESNTCQEAPNVYCYGIDFDCCDMLYNSRQSLNKKENPRLNKKWNGNKILKP
eukprot:TRINITY_DN14273_c0_g1_i1.p1 TRINITY_DN14273_c0_g1~~TRINITY_DN14273_c0_g1_i1.p1  ORF type:complete len:475 (+),score=115.34 TRINITY_DN14273_c0_g1_i1:36-1460(+)